MRLLEVDPSPRSSRLLPRATHLTGGGRRRGAVQSGARPLLAFLACTRFQSEKTQRPQELERWRADPLRTRYVVYLYGMSAPDIDQSVMDQFSALTGDAELTILLGAGASAPSGLPTWDEFATRVLVTCGLVKNEKAAAILLKRQDPTIALEAAHSRACNSWHKKLLDALYGELPEEPRPSPVHLAAAGHFLAQPRTTTLATLNFDTLLEVALVDEGTPSVSVGVGQHQRGATPCVHHLHGVVYEGGVMEPVVGYRDFAELVANQDAWQRKFLNESLSKGPLLLAGTSYRDPDIRHWLHQALRESPRPHPALVTIVREGLELERAEFESVKEALAEEWESIGLSALIMHDLADVASVIRELRYLGLPGYRSPKQRSVEVWRRHSLLFDEMQPSLSQSLLRDTEAVAETLGVNAHQGTLWLARGNGKLARFATASTRFESARHLKSVPTGHDSPWIAGEAIGTEEVKLRDVDRERGVTPPWRSVLAIPIFVGDKRTPDFATAVITFGLASTAAKLDARQDDWSSIARELSSSWGAKLSAVAFDNPLK